MPSQRGSTVAAALVGALVGASAAWLGPARVPASEAPAAAAAPSGAPFRSVTQGRREAFPPPAPPETSEQEPEPTTAAPEPSGRAAAQQPGAPDSTERASAATDSGLEELASPRERPVQSEAELRAAEVRCDQRLAAECLRAAAAYAEGKVVKGDPQRVTRNQKIARTLYVRQCSASDAVACFQLARLYSEGELVPADPKNAKVLRDRAAEICATKQTALCDEIRRHAAK